MTKRLKIGLALGCGGAKGLAHLGVLKILEKNNIPIDFIAGSSIGALVGGLYAAYGSVKPLEEILFSTDIKKVLSLIDPSFHKSGLLSGDKVEKFIEQKLGRLDFKDLKIPFTAVATDFKSSREVLINRGKVSSAIRSSISVPFIFRPIERDKKILVDGGLSNPVPVDVARKMGAEAVIAVNLDNIVFGEKNSEKAVFGNKLNLYNIAVFSLQILRYNLAKHSVQEADWLIEPVLKDVQGVLVGWDKFVSKEREELIRAGELAAAKVVKSIKIALAKQARQSSK